MWLASRSPGCSSAREPRTPSNGLPCAEHRRRRAGQRQAEARAGRSLARQPARSSDRSPARDGGRSVPATGTTVKCCSRIESGRDGPGNVRVPDRRGRSKEAHRHVQTRDCGSRHQRAGPMRSVGTVVDQAAAGRNVVVSSAVQVGSPCRCREVPRVWSMKPRRGHARDGDSGRDVTREGFGRTKGCHRRTDPLLVRVRAQSAVDYGSHARRVLVRTARARSSRRRQRHRTAEWRREHREREVQSRADGCDSRRWLAWKWIGRQLTLDKVPPAVVPQGRGTPSSGTARTAPARLRYPGRGTRTPRVPAPPVVPSRRGPGKARRTRTAFGGSVSSHYRCGVVSRNRPGLAAAAYTSRARARHRLPRRSPPPHARQESGQVPDDGALIQSESLAGLS